MPLYPIISLDILATSSVRGPKWKAHLGPSVSPNLGERRHAQTLAMTWPWSHHSTSSQRSHSVSKCGSCFQKPKPFSSSHPHSSHPVRTTSPPHAQAAAQPPSAKPSEPTHPGLCQHTRSASVVNRVSTPAPGGLLLFAPLSPVLRVQDKGTSHCILGSEGLGFNSSSSRKSSWRDSRLG